MVRIIIYTITGMILGVLVFAGSLYLFGFGDAILFPIGGGILGAILANYLNKKDSVKSSLPAERIENGFVNPAMPLSPIRKALKILLWIILIILLAYFLIFFFGGVDSQPLLSFWSSVKNESSELVFSLRTLWWKKLVVEESGFEIKYPRDWEAHENKINYDRDPIGYGIGFVVVSPRIDTGERDSISLTIINLNSPPWPYNLGDLFPDDPGSSDAGSLVVGGKTIIKNCSDEIHSFGCNLLGFGFTKGGYEYMFGVDLRATDGKNMETIDRILSTFRFIEPDILNWQTYRNNEYGYQIEIPKSWFALAPGGGQFGEDCIRNPGDKPVVIFSQENLEQCGFVAEQLPPQDADITILVGKPYDDIYSILGSPVERITMAGEPAALYRFSYQQARPNINAARIYFNYADRDYLIFLKNENAEGISYDSFYNQILSTFRFIPSTPLGTGEPEVCIQVITPARNSQTGETRDFPTPCDVPEGWVKI